MCNVDCIRWAAKNLSSEEVKGKRVIEVGSYDVNGSLRYIVELLKPAEYIGVDVVEGPGVDIICACGDLVKKFGRESFDMVISTCTLEHIRDWKSAVSNIKMVCRSNGMILMIVPSQWRFHEYPYDFWRYGKEDMEHIFGDCDILVLEEDDRKPSLVYMKTRKPRRFEERDLSQYELYSVIAGKRTSAIPDADLGGFRLKRRLLKHKAGKLLSKVSRVCSVNNVGLGARESRRSRSGE